MIREVDIHFLKCIKLRLEQLYEEHPNDPALREHISDEVGWIDAEFGLLTRDCPVCGGDCAAANPPIHTCPRALWEKTDNYRRYAALEIVRQAVVSLKRHGDINGVTTEKMMKLFPDIKTGWEQ